MEVVDHRHYGGGHRHYGGVIVIIEAVLIIMEAVISTSGTASIMMMTMHLS